MDGEFRGEFTKKIDQELIMRHSTSEEREAARSALDKEALERKRLEIQRSQDQEAERRLAEVESALHCRTEFLRARFPNMAQEEPPQGRGIRYRFQKGAEFLHDASLELRVRDNEGRQAIFVESSMEVVGRYPAKHDYITFPSVDLRVERVKKFVEKKILEFIKAYLD